MAAWGAFITSIAGLVSAVAILLAVLRTKSKVDTSNGRTTGQLAESTHKVVAEIARKAGVDPEV